VSLAEGGIETAEITLCFEGRSRPS
jgi:hypothetical protein